MPSSDFTITLSNRKSILPYHSPTTPTLPSERPLHQHPRLIEHIGINRNLNIQKLYHDAVHKDEKDIDKIT